MPETFGAVLLGPGGGSGSGVTSFNGRTGAVLPASGDYTPSEVGAPALATLTAVGDLYVASASGVVTRLAAGAAGTVLEGKGAGVLPAYGVPPGTLLNSIQYAPSTLSSYVATTTMAALDATNITLSFTVPASGNVDIDVEIFLEIISSSGGEQCALGLLDHTTHAQVGLTIVCAETDQTTLAFSSLLRPRFHLTGLTAGAHQLDLGAAAGSATTGSVNLYAQGFMGSPTGSNRGPALMQAFAA